MLRHRRQSQTENLFLEASKYQQQKDRHRRQVWNEQPMNEAIRTKKMNLLSIYSLLGGEWGSEDWEKKKTLMLLMEMLEKDEKILTESNAFVKWTLLNATDQVKIFQIVKIL